MTEKWGQGYLPKVTKVENQPLSMGLGPGLSINGLSDSTWREYIMAVGDISLQGWRKVPQVRAPTQETPVSVRTCQGFSLPKVTAQP